MPSNSVTYKAQEIKDAIEAAYGVMPHITCDNRGELAEVSACCCAHSTTQRCGEGWGGGGEQKQC